MKHLKLAAAILAAVCATSAVAAQPNQTLYILHDNEGSHLRAGDVLVADGHGAAALYSGNSFVRMVHDPEDLLASRESSSKPLYITDAEGNVVRGTVSNYQGDLYLSAEAPQIVYYKKEFIDSKAHQAKPGGGGGSADMTWHGGTILTSNKTLAIFWGNWSNPGDMITGLDSFFGGWGGSGMAGDSTEYTGSNGQVSANSTYLGHTIDSSTPPSRALSTSGAVGEACKITGNNPDPNGVYFIFTSTGAGHVSYCAWHSWGNCSNGAPVQVAYMPNITGLAGCDPGSYAGHSEGLAAIASVTSHELSETITDPRGAGWFDSSNGENGDKCAWAFHGNETLKNGSQWYLQGEWSNYAYDHNSGFPNRSGQNGCLY
jgi:hypothetical protein